MNHLRLVDNDPPDLDDDGGDGGGDEGGEGGLIAVDCSISGLDDTLNTCRAFLPGDASPELIADRMVMVMRGVVASYDIDVQLAFERRLLHWGDPNED